MHFNVSVKLKQPILDFEKKTLNSWSERTSGGSWTDHYCLWSHTAWNNLLTLGCSLLTYVLSWQEIETGWCFSQTIPLNGQEIDENNLINILGSHNKKLARKLRGFVERRGCYFMENKWGNQILKTMSSHICEPNSACVDVTAFVIIHCLRYCAHRDYEHVK